MRLINLCTPVRHMLPEVEPPARKGFAFNERMMWTVLVLVIYLICCQIPLYGIGSRDLASETLNWPRAIFASNRGTLMEFGISPIITSSVILQLLVGANIVDVDMGSADDRSLFLSTQKLFSIVIAVG